MAEPKPTDVLLQAGLEMPDDRRFYFNGFVVSMTPPDAIIILLQNNKPIAFLNASHTVAKSLSVAMQGVVKDFEKNTQKKIPLLEEFQKKKAENASS